MDELNVIGISNVDAMEIRLFTFDTSLFFSSRSEIKFLASASLSLSLVAAHLNQALAMLESEYSSVKEFSATQVDAIECKLRDHGESESPFYVFTSFLACGRPSPALEAYLRNTLGEKGIKRWKTVVETGYANIKRLISVHVLPAYRRLLVLLSELLGLSRLEDYFLKVGLAEAGVLAAAKRAKEHFALYNRLLAEVDTDLDNFENFINWITEEVLAFVDSTAAPTIYDGDKALKFFSGVVKEAKNNLSLLYKRASPSLRSQITGEAESYSTALTQAIAKKILASVQLKSSLVVIRQADVPSSPLTSVRVSMRYKLDSDKQPTILLCQSGGGNGFSLRCIALGPSESQPWPDDVSAFPLASRCSTAAYDIDASLPPTLAPPYSIEMNPERNLVGLSANRSLFISSVET
ncbi:Anaphase-promoting complex subunit 4 [Irineochytrium annulatum]|nr:Anaphase-promoting complex subunit 4 [Irineochytrium annulatum]